VFSEYVEILSEYELRSVEFVNITKALADAKAALAAEKKPVVLFCLCYSSQLGIRLAAEMPDKVSQLIFLEPYFVEFHLWMKVLLPITFGIWQFMRFLDWLGIRRKNFTYQPNYVALAKHPIYFQPFFDMRWQNMTDYFHKCYDILTYKLPARVDAPTLMMFSPKGFSRSSASKEKLKEIFPHARMVEMREGTHNVITMGAPAVSVVIREFLNAND
jgi:pimeloyl-ACP methyl ester carboxylesterase